MKTKEITVYVVGFLFNPTYSRVLLIEKLNPEWQRGLLNGVGGKKEPGETAAEAMTREFKEEAGTEVFSWRYFCNLGGKGFLVHFFCAEGDVHLPKAMEAEKLKVIEVRAVSYLPVIPNLRWLIPMAADKHMIIASAEERNQCKP